MRFIFLVILSMTFFLFYSIFVQDAYAYLDAGTGSYIIQLIIAAFLGGVYAVKIFWNKIKTFFQKLFSREK